jgi:hypothetical protein
LRSLWNLKNKKILKRSAATVVAMRGDKIVKIKPEDYSDQNKEVSDV